MPAHRRDHETAARSHPHSDARGWIYLYAQNVPAPPRGVARAAAVVPAAGPPPAYADLNYAPPEPATSNGHKLDLYIPEGVTAPLPVVIWTSGSAWFADTGKNRAGLLAAQLNPAGYAVAGVSIRSSSQVKFPGQLHDIKAAIRWLRANAAKYNLDPGASPSPAAVPEAGPRRWLR